MAIPLLNCTKLFKFRCPKTWSSLEGKPGDRVRFCQSCKKNVYLCQTPEEVRTQAQIGACIAIVAKEREGDQFMIAAGEPDPDELDVLDDDCASLYFPDGSKDVYLLELTDENAEQAEDRNDSREAGGG